MKRRIWLTVLIFVCALFSAVGISACNNQSPWCGTYYGGESNVQTPSILTITEKKIKLNDGSESVSTGYTISGDTITCDTGAKFKLAENYNVAYMEQYYAGTFPVQQRNGFFTAVRWVPISMSNTIINFQPDGKFMMTISNDATYIYSGKYTLNSGVLILNTDSGYSVVGNSITKEEFSARLYMYVTENYSVYSKVHLRDYRLFIEPSEGDLGNSDEDTTPSNPSEPSEDHEQDKPNKPVEPSEEHQQLHQELEIGSTCPECGLEIYLRSDESILLYNRNKEYARAEYYGESATNVFSAFSSVVRDVYISKNVKSIGNDAFLGCYALKTVVIAENSSLNSVGYSAFRFCEALTEFTIPASATEQINIGGSAFQCCSKLSSISLPENVTSVGMYAFNETAWYYAQPGGEIAYLGHIAYQFKGTVPFDSTLSIKEGTTVIADYCFYNQGMLRRITLPESLQYIGEYAFDGCTSLLNVELPKNLVSIGIYAFSNCISITEVTIPASLCRIGYSAFYGCNSLTKVMFESAEGWVDGNNSVVDFSDPVANVEKLKNNYYSSYYYEKTKEEV